MIATRPTPLRTLLVAVCVAVLATALALVPDGAQAVQHTSHSSAKKHSVKHHRRHRVIRYRGHIIAKQIATPLFAQSARRKRPPTTSPAPAPAPAPAPTPTPTPTSNRLYADTSAFNTRIGSTPTIAANSAAMVGKSLVGYKSSANFANSDYWGIAMVNGRSTDPQRVVSLYDWGYGFNYTPSAIHIPDGAKQTLGDDHHLVVFDGGHELDMWVGFQESDMNWKAGARMVEPTTGSGIAGPASGNAAGFALAAGVIRPEEIAAGRIDHALVFTSPYVRNSYVSPAVHGDGKQTDPDAMPMGTRIQLDPSVDISGLPTYKRIVAQALKDYGAYLADSSGSLAIRGEASIGRASTGGPSDIWTPVGVTDTNLSTLPWDHMRVIAP